VADAPSYELIFIVHPEVAEDVLAATVEKVGRLISDAGGQVLQTDKWGKRRLVYPIRKVREGYYTLMRLTLKPRAIPELERNLRLIEPVIRHLVVRTST